MLLHLLRLQKLIFYLGGLKGLIHTSCGGKIFFLKVSVPFYFLYFLTNRTSVPNVLILTPTKAVGELAFPIMNSGLSSCKVFLQRTTLVHTQDNATGLELSPEKKVKSS